jgi:hypothetical protein
MFGICPKISTFRTGSIIRSKEKAPKEEVGYFP